MRVERNKARRPALTQSLSRTAGEGDRLYSLHRDRTPTGCSSRHLSLRARPHYRNAAAPAFSARQILFRRCSRHQHPRSTFQHAPGQIYHSLGNDPRRTRPMSTRIGRLNTTTAKALIERHSQENHRPEHEPLDLGAVDPLDDNPGPLQNDLRQQEAEHRAADRPNAA